jgi:hypothetical protein
VQHAPFGWNYLSLFPSRRSIAQGALPDLLLMAGDGYAQWLLDAGVPAERVAVLGAIRFERMVGSRAVPRAAALCCTGIELDEAIELAVKATVALSDMRVPLLINFHPITDASFRASVRDAVRKAAGGSEHVTLSTAPMRDLLDQASAVLYMTSAACFEAVANGRTAIHVGRELVLDYDKLPEVMALRCSSRDDLRAWLRQPDRGKCAGQFPDALEQWLAPVVDAATLRKLLTGARSLHRAAAVAAAAGRR